MPWDITERDGKFCVIKRDDGENEGCHDTREEAERQMRALYASEERASVDTSPWDGNAAMSAAKTAADYRSICAGERSTGEPDERSHWALPHHKRPGSPPNAAGVRNALARLPQTEGLKNAGAARRHLEAHMSSVSEDRGHEESDRRFPIETREATLADVNVPERLIEVVAVPYGGEALIEYRGELWRESFERGAFAGIETRSRPIKAIRDHDKTRLVGKTVSISPERQEGLVSAIKIAQTDLGDETLSLAKDEMLDVSAGFAVPGSGQVLNPAQRTRRVRKAFLDHIAFVADGAYEDARVLSVRRKNEQAADLKPLVTPLLDDVVAWMESRRQSL